MCLVLASEGINQVLMRKKVASQLIIISHAVKSEVRVTKQTTG